MSSQGQQPPASLDEISKEQASIIKDANLPPLTKTEIQGAGEGLGIISPTMFEPTKWSPKTPILDLQYVKFITIMVSRIRAGESDVQEVKLFFELLTTDNEGDAFWAPIEKLVPEVTLRDRSPPKVEDGNPPLQLLYELLYTELAERNEAQREDWAEARYLAKRGMVPRDKSISPECDTWLTASGRDKLKNTLFGEKTYVAPGSRQDRMLRSWMEIGYPKRAQGGESPEGDMDEPEHV